MARKSSGKAAGNKEKQGKIVYLTNIECAPPVDSLKKDTGGI
jgi:hypothetical protein